MKVLYICSLFSPHRGGIETMVDELAHQWTAKGEQAVILTKRYPALLPEFEIIRGIRVFRFPLAKNKLDYEKLGKFLKKNEEALKSDVIHIVGLRRPAPLIGWKLANKWGGRLIGTICGGEIPLPDDLESEKVWAGGKYTVSPFFKRFDRLTACSGFLKRILLSRAKGLSIKTLHAGINCHAYSDLPAKKRNRPYIFSLRRLVQSKGVDVLIRSFIKASKKMPGVDLVIAGSGPEEKNLKKLAEEEQIAKRTFFLGDLALSESIRYLKGAICTAVPSRSEGGSLVNTEALAVGCPVVASRVGGIPEYVGPGGLLFQSENENQLAERLLELRWNNRLRIDLIKKGRKFALGFDWEKIFPEYEKIYRKKAKHAKPAQNEYFPQKTKNILNWISKNL
jgi:glycosyltransferase involved in cell wall biosynthesis